MLSAKFTLNVACRGIEELVNACAPETWYIGLALEKLGREIEALTEWIVEEVVTFNSMNRSQWQYRDCFAQQRQSIQQL